MENNKFFVHQETFLQLKSFKDKLELSSKI